ncbi:mannosyl-oligosaccharide alpha-1,2-mannosidase IA-like [Culicoides brevitarsis]|uniref:mannosyl-oligosaccharide alpha-1,2-mannosidase IA-like n=1 Tax=Culicoides brevitarsis TaxID=469753 RepID=UPI00307B286C
MRRFSLIFVIFVLSLSLVDSFHAKNEDLKKLTGNVERREKVKEMMIHAWSNYKKFAWGANELSPMFQKGHRNSVFGSANIGATIVDAMDTLYLMGLTTEFNEGREWIATEFSLDRVNYSVSVFETNIRYVGGFLSLYALTGDSLFKEKAKYVADKLLVAFDTPTGIPFSSVNFMTGEVKEEQFIALSEFGTLYLEFAYLSEITGDEVYKNVVDRIYDTLEAVHDPSELHSTHINPKTGIWKEGNSAMGAYGDSFYEYLLKAWILTKNDRFKEMFLKAMNVTTKKLLQRSKTGLVYLASIKDGELRKSMEHLACFTGGLFALAATSIPETKILDFMDLAKNITHTCHELYRSTPTGLGPEVFHFEPKIEVFSGYYALRPETVESYFYLWRTTKDPKYREWGWQFVESLEKHCRSPFGYSGISNVFVAHIPLYDLIQQSFFLAETLKYLYLLYSDDSLLPLDKWVFNTEAHPLPILNEHRLRCRKPKIF